MWKSGRFRELSKLTLQQKAIQDILKAFSDPVEVLDLGERAKLNQRGTSLLIDLIKASDLDQVKFGDCVLMKSILKVIKNYLLDKEDSLIFQKCVSFGVEGALLIKAILKKKSPKNFAAADCELGLIQIKHIVDGLMEMKHSEIDELNMRGNSLGNGGIGHISRLIEKKRVKKISIARCFVTAVHLKQLSEGVNKMKGTMDVIDLRGNTIQKRDVEFFRKTVDNKVVSVTFF